MAAPFDTLKLARALRDRAGFSQEHAEAAADVLAEATEQVATKQDVADLRNEMKTEFAAVRAEMQAGCAGLGAEAASVRSDMTSGLREIEQPMTIRLGGMLVIVTGILLAAKFLG